MEYNYKALRAAAMAPGATQDDVNALGEWCQTYLSGSWNGEEYDIDDGHSIRPIFRQVLEDGWELDHWEIN